METTFVAPLSEMLVRKLISLEITVKEAEDLKKLIEARTDYIVRKIADITGLVTDWWDFENEVKNKRGFFDPLVYHTNIEFVGNFEGDTKYKGFYFNSYSSYFPIEFLWGNFEEIVKQKFQKFKDKLDADTLRQHQIKIENDNKLKEIIASVKSKVSKEEFSYLSFGLPKNKKP